MRSLSNATLDHVQRFEEKFDKEGVEAKFKEATSLLSGNESQKSKTDDVTTQIENRQIEQVVFEVNEPIVEEEKIEETLTEETTEVSIEEVVSQNNAETEVYLEDSLAEETVTIQEEENEVIEKSVEDSVILETKVNTFSEEPVKNSVPKDDELEVIEGIGPKIAMVLYDAGIFTFRDLAITPVYKIQEILDAAGPQFASHDPSTWTQQAKLAAEGRWADLEALKFYLVGGREPKKDEVEEIHETIEENEIIEVVEETKIVEEPEIEIPVIEEVIDTTPSFTAAPIQSENNLDSITEEMLEKVNKVKAAIRKAMVEKNDGLTKDTTPLPTVNDIIAKNESSSGSSFFDNL
jgi:predicted flap endonuclease-1-like 5' DNA nuclease